MKKGMFLFGYMLVLITARGQDRGAAAARVLAAPLSHPVHVASGGVRVELRGVYVCEGLLWLSFRADNRSAIDFRAGAVRVAIRDRKAFKRRALQEMALAVVFRQEPSVLRSDSTVAFCDGVAPRVPGKGQEVVVEWAERDGDRRVELKVPAKRVLRAGRIE
jgi:hypothetical protein